MSREAIYVERRVDGPLDAVWERTQDPDDHERWDLWLLTEYDYDTRWGALGRLIDRLAFRPLLGWATARSFDVLARWVEDGTPPEG